MALPPKPDKGAVAAALLVIGVLKAVGFDWSSAIVAGIVVGIVILPFLFMAREFAVFRSRRELKPDEAGVVAEWIREAGYAAGVRSPITVLYTFRKGLGLQVVQLGAAEREEAQLGLLQLLHRAAWSAMPAAARTKRGSILVAVPGRVMETLHQLMGRGRQGVYMRVETPGHVRLAYNIVKELVRAGNQGAGGVYAAYVATKALARMLMKGWIVLGEPSLAEEIDRIVPPEPWWVRRRVKQQLAEEASLAIRP